MGKYPVPGWAKKARKRLIDKDMTVKDLAEAMDVTYSYLVAVLNGQKENHGLRDRIISYLEKVE